MSHHLVRSHTLTKSSLKTVAADIVLSALAATPVFAQVAIQEPGAFAFYHPYLDVLNGGAPTPAAKLTQSAPAGLQAHAAEKVASAPSVYSDIDPTGGTADDHRPSPGFGNSIVARVKLR